jgi:hypothetical protein
MIARSALCLFLTAATAALIGQLHWVAGIAAGVLVGILPLLAMLERSDELTMTTRESDASHHEEIVERAVNEARERYDRDMAAGEKRLLAAEEARRQTVKEGARINAIRNETIAELRKQRDEERAAKDAALDRADRALEEAAHIKRHAELLEETAREIARQSGRSRSLPPPLHRS